MKSHNILLERMDYEDDGRQEQSHGLQQRMNTFMVNHFPEKALKEKLLSDNIKRQHSQQHTSMIDPLQLHLYSITNTILSYHHAKSKSSIQSTYSNSFE